MATDRWLDKEDVLQVYIEYYSAIKEWNNAICSNMDGPRDYHNKWSKPEKDKQNVILHILGI